MRNYTEDRCNLWRKNDLRFHIWYEEFDEFSHQLKVMLDKSSVYNVLAERMYFLDKST